MTSWIQQPIRNGLNDNYPPGMKRPSDVTLNTLVDFQVYLIHVAALVGSTCRPGNLQPSPYHEGFLREELELAGVDDGFITFAESYYEGDNSNRGHRMRLLKDYCEMKLTLWVAQHPYESHWEMVWKNVCTTGSTKKSEPTKVMNDEIYNFKFARWNNFDRGKEEWTEEEQPSPTLLCIRGQNKN